MESHPATAGHVTSIQLFRLGFSENKTTRTPTQYIYISQSIMNGLETKWPPVVRTPT